MILCGEQGADVSFEHEVGLHAPLDSLDNLGIGGVDKVANLLTDLLLPLGQRLDVGVHPRILLIRHCCNICEASPQPAL